MPVCTQTIFQRGGRELLDLLTHCVFSFNPDVLFLYLVREYQFRPQATGAVAIYDVFCDPRAPAKVSAVERLPPYNAHLEQTVTQLRWALQTANGGNPPTNNAADAEASPTQQANSPPLPPSIPLPPRFLFDSIANDLTNANATKITALEQYYDPSLTPKENLPSGELSDGQRVFVDHVWTPRIRPHLVSAGFWRMATVG